ncbi:MAG: hypothetical protein JZU62_02330 [Sulfuricurvum sp.]|uniref:hypothetical protein n=1 Tax=Sulfuricurvum sp. TaxID=2025608 RepID=UPI0025EBEA0C|nr:hypothetical protein [Sulfuricurvum sp.]MBV5320498.1 hypothetical protein [Sulfuricurvum sp.]
MNRQTLFVVILSLLLLIGVVGFSFLFLIPKGKEYRSLRLESKKEFQQLELTQNRYDNIHNRLEDLKHEHRHTIGAFDKPFNPGRFEHLYKKEFTDLYLTEMTTLEGNGTFKVYEVNATSKITSPQSFYTFLENINKSEWVIGVNFPVHFERDGDQIRSSFTMKVHNKPADQEHPIKEKEKKSEKREKNKEVVHEKPEVISPFMPHKKVEANASAHH